MKRMECLTTIQIRLQISNLNEHRAHSGVYAVTLVMVSTDEERPEAKLLAISSEAISRSSFFASSCIITLAIRYPTNNPYNLSKYCVFVERIGTGMLLD
jgi:hypothetical protein